MGCLPAVTVLCSWHQAEVRWCACSILSCQLRLPGEETAVCRLKCHLVQSDRDLSGAPVYESRDFVDAALSLQNRCPDSAAAAFW